MLGFFSKSSFRDCERLPRRDFLTAGTVGALSLPWLFEQRANAAAENVDYIRDKAVVLLFCGGGMSHIESFNPRMDLPAPYYSTTGELKTNVPGITLGGTFPLLAKHADKLAAIRNFRHPVGSHAQAISHVLTGGTDPNGRGLEGHSIGSAYAKLRGTNHPVTGMPTYALLLDEHKDRQYRKEYGRVVKGSRPGPLGPSVAPFNPSGKGTALSNMKLNLPADRLKDRRALLKGLNQLKRGLDRSGVGETYSQYEQQAVDLITGAASKAFDLSQEKPKLVERYDTSMYKCGKKVFEPSELGHMMLTARRLVEAGCGFVTVQSAGWDMHADSNNPGIVKGMNMLGPTVDKAVSAFLEDLKDRGLSDKVLLVITGDFGRTPKINNRGGRDHWARLSTLAFFGGGIKTGQAVGKSDRQNGSPEGDSYDTSNMLGTIMNVLFDVGQLRVARGAPSDLLKLIEKSKPIRELF